MKRALIVIAQDGYQDVELEGTRKGLMEAGFDITLASVKPGECRGKFGGVEQAELAMSDVPFAEFDRMAFIGGPGAHALADNKDAKKLASEWAETEKPLGAICVAPTILATAGVLRGKSATVWDDGTGAHIDLLKEHGALYSGEAVTVDGRIVTGNGPEAALEFGRTLAQLG